MSDCKSFCSEFLLCACRFGRFLDKPIVVCMVPSTNEFSRAPSSHTCGCVLKIPDSYTSVHSVQDLRLEFNSILKSNIWVMDYA